jgi:sugar lactone lactonase YvrE
VGKGLRITGTDVNGWQEVSDYCNDYASRAWGMFQERGGIYYVYGNMYIGDSAQTEVTSFIDDSRVIRFGDFEFLKPIVQYDTSTQVTNLSDVYIRPDGVKMYVVDDVGDVYQYTLSTPGDVSSASYDTGKTLSTGTQPNSPRGLFFSSDGSKLYIPAYTTSPFYLYQYDLGTDWDISTASYGGTHLDFSGESTNVTGVTFASDGYTLYLCDTTDTTIYQYTLGTAWDLSTASFASKTYDTGGETTNLLGLCISSDGYTMYIISDSADTVFQYTMGTQYDVSTSSYGGKFLLVSGQTSSPTGVFLIPGDESSVFVTDLTNNYVIQYSLDVAGDVSELASLSSIPDGFNGLTVEDALSYTTTFQDGVLVGSDAGRSGSVFIGSDDCDATFDLTPANNSDSVVKLYGSTLQGIDGGITFGDDSDHHVFSVSFNGCAQVYPGGTFSTSGSPQFRNCLFVDTADVDAALLWTDNIDIEDCAFIANTTGAAIEHESSYGSPYTYTSLIFSGNTYDVLNSSGSAIIVTKAGTPISDPSTYEGSLVTFQASLTITITVQDVNTDPILGVQTAVYKISDRTEIMNEDTIAGGIASEIYVGSTPVDVEIRCRKASSGATKYKNFSTLATLNGNFDLLVTLVEDTVNNATS